MVLSTDNSDNVILAKKVFSLRTNDEFEPVALEVFRYQYEQNDIYHSYIDALGVKVAGITKLQQIPFLPVSFFKTHKVVCGKPDKKDTVFYSSTTTGGVPSAHMVKDIEIYRKSFLEGFRLFYGDIKEYCILALLPSYLERSGSSLVYMAEELIKQSNNPDSGFYLNNQNELSEKIKVLEQKGQKTLLLGVTYALLDFAEHHTMKLKHTTIMETGGMKGKRREMPREEVHTILKKAFRTDNIHSEYGMTELLSQAYSKGNGVFNGPPWMRIVIRDIYDPLKTGLVEEGGVINIIDLANINSCSFIATDDAGVLHKDGSFEISGRLDQSDIRGCNLMAEEL